MKIFQKNRIGFFIFLNINSLVKVFFFFFCTRKIMLKFDQSEKSARKILTKSSFYEIEKITRFTKALPRAKAFRHDLSVRLISFNNKN